MKRDVIGALIVGFLLGSLFAVAIVNLPTLLSKAPKLPMGATPSEQPKPTEIIKASTKITLKSPEDQSIATSKTASISGDTIANASIVIDSDLDTFVLEASSDGKFSKDVVLREGNNNFFVTGYYDDGESETKVITVYYIEEKL